MRRFVSIFIRPDRRLSNEILVIQKSFARRYRAYSGLNWKGPHLTVYTMAAEHGKTMDLMLDAAALIERAKPFTVHISGTGYFTKREPSNLSKRNYVIFLRVRRTPGLMALRTAINRSFIDYRVDFPRYNPHITITLRDLGKDAFYRALKEYKGLRFSRSFRVNRISLSASAGNSGRRIVRTVSLKG